VSGSRLETGTSRQRHQESDNPTGRRVNDHEEFYIDRRQESFIPCRSDLEDEDSDEDGLNDSEELRETRINVTRTADPTNPVPLRWTPESDEFITVTSNATDPHSDGDGVMDGEEVLELHTDPSDTQTYAQTDSHESRLEGLYDSGRSQWAGQMGTPGLASDAVQIENGQWEVTLDDATDDFDFVFNDGASGAIDRSCSSRCRSTMARIPVTSVRTRG